MPPKKGKEGKGKKKGKGKVEEVAPEGPTEAEELPDKEKLLQIELDKLTTELESLKGRVLELRQENDWLQKEADKVRVESHEYMSYMEKKTNKRQTTIISLTDQNRKEIQDIAHQKQVMLEEYEMKKQALADMLQDKEKQLSDTRQELDNLEDQKESKRKKEKEIKDLKEKVREMRATHSEGIQRLKTQFLQEKQRDQHDSENQISTMSKKANQEAIHYLSEHTKRIEDENRRLRHELLSLIHKSRALHEHKHTLDNQHSQLLTEQQYARDLKKLRTARQHKVLKALGMSEEDDQEDLSATQS